MPHRLVEHRLVEHQVRLGQAGLHVADLPLVGDRAVGRHLAPIDGGPVDVVPLDGGQLAARHGVAVEPGIRPSGAQALQRIHGERQRLQIHPDPLDRVGRRRLVDGRDGQNRLALVHRLVREPGLVRRVDGRQLVGGQDDLDPRASPRPRWYRCCARAHEASGSAAASRTACRRRGSPPRTSRAQSPWRPDPPSSSSCRSACSQPRQPLRVYSAARSATFRILL